MYALFMFEYNFMCENGSVPGAKTQIVSDNFFFV